VKEIESGERDKSAAAMDERMSASRREGKTGTSEADLPKDAASLYWYDAESTSYLSTEADNRRATEPLRYRRALWNLPVSTSFLCMQLAPKGGSSVVNRTRVILCRGSPAPAVPLPCALGRDTDFKMRRTFIYLWFHVSQ
jgi:hypothetical protein